MLSTQKHHPVAFASVASRKQSLRQILAANIRRVRKQRGWSQEDLGAEAELHRTFIGAVERGETNISIDNIERLAIALGIEAMDLFRR